MDLTLISLVCIKMRRIEVDAELEGGKRLCTGDRVLVDGGRGIVEILDTV